MASRSGTTRGALGLYGVLVVLPTLVFGGLYWRALVREHEDQLLQVPREADAAARSIVDGMRERVERLIEVEEERPFYVYSDLFMPEDMRTEVLALQESPLQKSSRPEGVTAWFDFDLAHIDEPLEIFTGDVPSGRAEELLDEVRPLLEDYRRRKAIENVFQRASYLRTMETRAYPLTVVAVFRARPDDLDCLARNAAAMQGREVTIAISAFSLEFFLTDEGRPVAVGARRVAYFPGSHDLESGGGCLEDLLGEGFSIQQGFVLDAAWLVGQLADSEAERILRDADEELLTVFRLGPLEEVCATCAPVYPVRELGFETFRPDDAEFGKLQVAIKTERLIERFAAQQRRFLGVAGVLVLTLATGMWLLYRSVSRELQHARRMQNFVAAVTHELRTPLSTIKLHGEMLLDGWAETPEKQREYFERILRETDRLEVLVERVLEKSRLKERTPPPQPGDLNAQIERLRADLVRPDGSADDLRFELAGGLPRVWLSPEAVAGILGNLVENARKYAPVPPGGEPILIRTARAGERVLLQVADRGPGVPEEEHERIFEAFHRLGSETTRRTTGTGLGLHLVELHARSLGAKASVQPREGGGSVFQVAFRAVT